MWTSQQMMHLFLNTLISLSSLFIFWGHHCITLMPQVVNSTSWHCRHHLSSLCKSSEGRMEIAIQSPMLALLLGVLLISPWEQIHHSLLWFPKPFIRDIIWHLCHLFCFALMDFEVWGEQRLFIVSFLFLSPQGLAHSRNARNICVIWVVEGNTKSTNLSYSSIFSQHKWGFQISYIWQFRLDPVLPQHCFKTLITHVPLEWMSFLIACELSDRRDCVSYSCPYSQGSEQCLSHSRYSINICRIKVSDLI